MTATLSLPRGATFRFCSLCEKPGRLHIDGSCHVCTTFPRTCRWTADCRSVAVVAAASPYHRQLEQPSVPVCTEHRRVAIAAGWTA